MKPTTLPPGWTCIAPATFADEHPGGWLVSVDDTDGATLVSRGDEAPIACGLSPREVMRYLVEHRTLPVERAA